MKNDDLIVIFIVIMVFIFTSKSSDVQAVDVYTLMTSEGMVAYSTLDISKEETISPVELCQCNGNKYIKSGDGLMKVKCPCGDSCNCKKTTGSYPQKSIIPSKQIIKIGAEWCGPCVAWDGTTKDNIESPGEELARKGWGVDEKETSYIRKIDVDKQPELAAKYLKGRALPTFILLENGVETKSIVGFTSALSITNMYYGK